MRLSVPEGKRSPNKLIAFVKAREMAVYTLKICKNTRNFPGRYRKVIDEITSTAWNIANYIWTANNIYVGNGCDPGNKARRRDYQNRAIELCKSLLFQIEMCYEAFPDAKDKYAGWSDKVERVKALIINWRDSGS